jgi:hypothetical protein
LDLVLWPLHFYRNMLLYPILYGQLPRHRDSLHELSMRKGKTGGELLLIFEYLQ